MVEAVIYLKLASVSSMLQLSIHYKWWQHCIVKNIYFSLQQGAATVRSLILRNRFLQIALKLLNTLLSNFAAFNHIEIVRFGYNHNFDSMSSGEIPMRLRHLVAEIFAKNHSAKIVNELSSQVMSLAPI